MADVKWIKITTDIFDDEKILLIESMPYADSIIVIWFKLLAFAGKQNNNGVFLMSNRIAYTDEMLSSIFRRDIKVIRLALDTFEAFGMIEIIDNVITIPNWNKHQTLDAYEKKKQRDRLYQAERRANQRALIEKSSDSQQTQSSDVAISDKEIEEDKDKDKDIEKDIKPKRNRFVPPTLEEVQEYCQNRQNGVDPQRFIDYYTSNGWLVGKNKMKDWKAAVRTWERNGYSGNAPSNPNKSYDTRDFFEAAVARSWDELSKDPPKTAGEDEDLRKRAEALKEKLS